MLKNDLRFTTFSRINLVLKLICRDVALVQIKRAKIANKSAKHLQKVQIRNDQKIVQNLDNISKHW